MKKLIPLLFCCVSVLTLASCGGGKQKQIPMHGAVANDPTKSATVMEGSLMFRALDGMQMSMKETPSPVADIVFAVTAGRHKIGAINIQGGHAAMPENMKCFSFDVTLDAGVDYIIGEDKEKGVGYIARRDTDKRILEVKPFDRFDAYSKVCDWKSQ